MLFLVVLHIAFAGSVMENYKAMLQQVKDNGVTSEETYLVGLICICIYILHLDVFLQQDNRSSEGCPYIAGSLCCCIYHVFEKASIHKNIDQNGNILKMKNI